MGSTFSFNRQPTEEPDTLPVEEPRRFPYHGNPVPAEASTAPGESETWYANFFEKAYCAPHKDGKNVIICWPTLPRGHVRDYRELDGWPIVKVRLVYEHLGEDHARIVRYVGDLDDGSIVVEKLSPGPFNLRLPVMTVPVPETPSRDDKVMLSLYYRWALQGLSALSFAHSHDVYFRTFSAQQIWLRSDYSLAITGFISADITGDKTDYGEGGLVTDESMPYDEGALHGSVKEDLFYWATFVWRLMTNDYTDRSLSVSTHCWEPVCPVGGCEPSDDNEEIFLDRLDQGSFQELEEARLGSILVKAWKEEYTSADEVADEIKAVASKMGINVNGDEVELDENWEDIFEVEKTGPLPRDRKLKFKQRLAAFLTNSNRLKGQISGGHSPGTSDFNGLLAGDEQLEYLRNFGMIFAYWNHADIWASWCASYNGMRTVLQQFDTAYGGANPVPANLAQKWATFNRQELNNIARIGREYVDLLYSTKKPVGGIWGNWWDLKWYTVMTAPIVNQRSYIKFTQTCANLPP